MICSFQSINSKIKDYVVIIAKRIHLFPFRTQKLSSLALMVLGGQPPGRVRRSHVMCRSGGTGRRTGLKILRDLPPVPVRFRSSAPNYHRGVEQLAARRAHNPKVAGSSPASATNYIWPIGQAVKTPPFHGGNRGSIPLWVTN